MYVGLDPEVEVRIAFCKKCQEYFYETGLMFTKGTVENRNFSRSPILGVDKYKRAIINIAYNNRQRLYWIERFLELKSSDRFLDIGCGYGNLGILFSKKYNLRLAAGVDLNEEYIAIAKGKQYKLKNKNVEFKCASAYKLPYEDRFFEKVLCAETLEHLAQPAKALAEMKRVCSQYIVIQIPTPNPLLFKTVGRLYEKVSGQNIYHAGSPRWFMQEEEYFPLHVFEPSSILMKRYIESQGMKIKKYVGTRMLPLPLDNVGKFQRFVVGLQKVFDYNLSQLFPFKLLGNQLIMQIEVA